MPPRIAYWLSSFDPDMEAVAGEVACLRRSFPGSIAWGVAPRNWLRLSWRSGFGIHPQFQLLFRAAVAVGQEFFDVNHLFGSAGDWFHLRAVRKHPVVLTITNDQPACESEFLEKVDRFVVEWPAATDRLRERGIPRDRISLIFPAVDLKGFQVAPAPEGPFTVLFASSPDRAEWLESRGVRLLLGAAALKPDIQFRLIWRPWGDSLPVVEKWIRESGLSNVELCTGRVSKMSTQYHRSHVTVAPFLNRETCKPAPQSLVESLACGRPVVLSDSVGISEVVTESGAGLRCSTNAESLADCLGRLQSEWDQYSIRARRTAERWFDSEAFIQSYQSVYDRVLPARTASVAHQTTGN